MPTKEQVTESLDEVLVPGVMRSLTKLNLVRQVAISDEKVDINLASAALSQETQEWLKSKVQDTVKKLPGAKDVNIDFAEMKPKDVNEIKKRDCRYEW